MINLFVLFVVVFIVGLAFWFYNRRQIQGLSEVISDKEAVIHALKDHYTEDTTNTDIAKNWNDNWRGGGTFTHEDTLVDMEVSKSKKTRTTKSSKPAAIKPKRSTKSKK